MAVNEHSRHVGDQMRDNKVIQGRIRVIMTLEEEMMTGFKEKTVEKLSVAVTGPRRCIKEQDNKLKD